jgi:hypothetical protein
VHVSKLTTTVLVVGREEENPSLEKISILCVKAPKLTAPLVGKTKVADKFDVTL